MGNDTNYQIRAPIVPPATIAASGSYDTGVFVAPSPGLSVGVLSSQPGILTLHRYLDAAKQLPVGSAIAASIVANTATVLDVNDGVPYLYCNVTVSNSSNSTAATISAFAIVASGTGH